MLLKTDLLQDKLEIEGVTSNGYGIMPKLVMQDTRLTIEAKAIYAYIVSFAGAGSTAFPSLKKILADLQISESRFYKHRKKLIECNYITLKQIRNEKKVIVKNIYILVANPKVNNVEGIPQNEGYPIPQNEGYPIPQNEGHIINNTKINNIKINNKKEGSQSSPSFLTDDDDINKNNNIEISTITSQELKKNINTLSTLTDKKEHLKPLVRNLSIAGLKETDVLAIIQFLCTLPEINQEVSDLVNAQIRANEREAKNGLTDYKAYFIKGLKLKLDNANLVVNEIEITDPNSIPNIPKVTLYDWVNES